jgi:5-formyltetrahydrofolate cyclo-ligase
MATDPNKQQLRKALLEQRAALSRDDLIARSAALTEHLVAHPLWLEARGIAAFVGVLPGEVLTLPLLERTIAAGKPLWLPRLTTPGHMGFWTCSDLSLLETRRMGLREPPAVGEGVAMPGPEHGVDLILVPGLAFGRDGARIGFGAGHYDRMFGESPTRATKCGVCLIEFVDPPGGPIPMHEHDVKMDWIATDAGVFAAKEDT